MDVRVDEVTGVRFVREPYPFPSFAGREVLTVQFLGPGGETVLSCYVHDLYDGQQMRPEKLAAWRALRERYGNRDESRVDRGPLIAPAVLNHRNHQALEQRTATRAATPMHGPGQTPIPSQRVDADQPRSAVTAFCGRGQGPP